MKPRGSSEIGPGLRWEGSPDAPVLVPSGPWTVAWLGELEGLCARLKQPATAVDLSALGEVDASGTVLLLGTLAKGAATPGLDARADVDRLARAIAQATAEEPAPPAIASGFGVRRVLARIGEAALHLGEEALGLVSYLGQVLAALGRGLVQPTRLRWHAIFHQMEEAGLDAVPIVATLSFAIGMVLAYLSASLLEQVGASVLTVELVSIAMMREFGVVLTAVVLAGRSDSAFAAQIGAMRMQREIDAMVVMGVDPIEALVVPRLLALLVMVPLLTFIATLAGIMGGMVVAWVNFDLSPVLFLSRMQETVALQQLLAGFAKAPVFALVILLVGTRQGMLVGGTVQSLGTRTTSAVVQALFLVIIIDALFAVLYLELGI
jgi:phospholipid/cholesterol/gamma-HCH transport system permease protein